MAEETSSVTAPATLEADQAPTSAPESPSPEDEKKSTDLPLANLASSSLPETSYIDPPAASTAAAANVRHQNRLMRLQHQEMIRIQLRQQYAQLYMQQVSSIQQMQAQLDAEKLG